MDGAQLRLVRSAKIGEVDGVKAALKAGAEVDWVVEEVTGGKAPGTGGRAAIHHAAAIGHYEVVQTLISNGADVNVRSTKVGDDGGSALHLAAEAGHTRVVRLLLESGAEPEAMDNKGRTAVHWAGLRGRLDSLKTLHSMGCDLHAQVEGSANVLHFSVASGDLEVVRWLVEEGVNREQRDKNKKLPSDVAKLKGCKDIHYYLKERVQPHRTYADKQNTISRQQDTLSRQKDTLSRQQDTLSRHKDTLSRQRDGDLADLVDRLRRLEEEKALAQQEARELRQQLEEVENQQPPTFNDNMVDDTMQQLQILSHQNKEYRRKVTQLEKKEVELSQRAAASREEVANLREELDRLSGMLRHAQEEGLRGREEVSARVEAESGASQQVAELTRQVQQLTVTLNLTTDRAAATQDSQRHKIEMLKQQEEVNRGNIMDLSARLRGAEERAAGLQAQLRDRGREVDQRESISQQTCHSLRQEITHLNHKLAIQHQQLQQQQQQQQQQPQPDFQKLQWRLQELTQSDATNKQTITSLRQHLDHLTKRLTDEQQKVQNAEQRLRARKQAPEGAVQQEPPSARLTEMTDKIKQYEKMIYSYKIRLGERERELKDLDVSSKRTIANLREEVKALTTRLDAVRKRAARTSRLYSEEEAGGGGEWPEHEV